jgi:antitoxin HicB
MLNYPITLTPATNGSFQVGFPDLPFVSAVGQDREDALAHARFALANAVSTLIEEGKPIPVPPNGSAPQPGVCLSALETAKILLWDEMQARQVSKDELAKRLGRRPVDIELLFDLGKPADIELIEKAANAIGKRLDIHLA